MLALPDEDTAGDWRVSESRAVYELFSCLVLPEVRFEWVQLAPKPRSLWTLEDDYLPRWEFGQARHGFLHGITKKLWESLDFDPNPPNALVKEWVAAHVDCEIDDSLPGPIV